ncbi:MAG: hypothetical protein JNL52_05645 [Flavobacteriales bacterium]|nr:hypothetical protein [Flavobacteriales bacterium]
MTPQRYLTALHLCMAWVITSAQEPIWLNHYSNNSENGGLNLTWDGQSAIYGIGTLGGATSLGDTSVSILGMQDVLIARWDSSGNLIWARTAGGTCQPSDIDNGFYAHYDEAADHILVNGQFTCPGSLFGSHVLNGSGPLSGVADDFIAAYSPAGECQWANRISSNGLLSSGNLVTDGNGGIYLSGSCSNSPVYFHGPSTMSVPAGGFIAKYDPDGGLIHAERVITNGRLQMTAWAGPTEWILCGQAKPGATLYGQVIPAAAVMGDGYVARVDTTGNVQWTTMLPSTESAIVVQTLVLTDGSIAVCGSFTGDLILPNDTLFGTASFSNSFLALLDDQGEIQWAVPFTASGSARVYSLGQDRQGDLLAYGQFEGGLQIGQTYVPQYGSQSGTVCRFSTDGVLKAAMTFGRKSLPSLGGSILATDHGIYLSSEFDSTLTLGSTVAQGPTNEFYEDLFLARFDSLSGFTSIPAPKVSANEHLHIYANPNEGLCTIEIPAAVMPGSDLVLTIHDALGREVQRVPLRWIEGTIRLDISAQAKGVYHAELMDGPRRYSGTIVFQ